MKIYITLSLILIFGIRGLAQCDPAFTIINNQAEIKFQASNTNAGVEHIWNFGVGPYYVYNAGANPSFTYPLPGNYSVTHIVRSESGGCADSNYVTITVDFQMTCDALFTITKDSLNYNKYILTPTTFGGTSARYDWKLDGVSIGSLSPFEVWLPEGRHEICLVNNLINCTATTCQVINVPPVPVCDWSASFIAASSSANPKKKSFTPSVSLPSMKFKWYFGDGGSSTATSPTYEYVEPGEYDVRLHITDTITNCNDTVMQHISLQPLPSDLCEASITFTTDPSHPNRITFTAISNQEITDQTWHLVKGDSAFFATLNEFNPTYNFPDTGYYFAMLELTTVTGCITYTWEYLRISSMGMQGNDAMVTPNPVYGSQIKIQLELQQQDPVKVSVYNSSGILVHSSQRTGMQGINQLNIPVDKLRRGVYYIHIQSKAIVKKSTFIKM